MGKPGDRLREILALPADLARAWRLGGPSGAAIALRERTIDRVWRRARFVVFALDLDDLREVPPPAGVTIERFDGPDWSPLARVVDRPRFEAFRRWVERGRVMLVARRGDDIVGYTFYSDRMEPDIEFYDLPLPEGAVYTWALYVVPSERGSGTGSALVSARLKHAREAGYRSCWRMVSVRNAPALKTVEKSARRGRAQQRVGELVWRKTFRGSRTEFLPDPVATPPGTPDEDS